MTRVAAYCRVSTDKSDQLHSFLSQKAFFHHYIVSRPDWVLTEIYTDEGITGTATAPRAGFLKMIGDAFLGKFDLIVTKEVSRFSRNILDAISYTRKLREAGVGVIFLNDGISTLDTDAELRLGIMASVAQEESRKTSERVRWGQQRKMEQGVVFGHSLLGYEVKEGKMTVEPEGAETVRQIYRMLLNDGMGVRAIAGVLSSNGTPTKSGGVFWSGATVLKILRNEKYCGDLVQKKTVTTDYLTHKKVKNLKGDLICLRDHHEPIISREAWEAAQHELRRRAPLKAKTESGGNKYALSGKIVCITCGATYLCRTRKRKDGSAYRVWTCRCACRINKKQHREDSLAQCIRYIASLHATEQLVQNLTAMAAKIIRNNSLSETSYKKELSALERRKLKLIDTYLNGDISREEYAFFKEQYENELLKLSDIQSKAETGAKTDEIRQVIAALASGDDTDDDFYLSLVGKIEVISDCVIQVSFKNSAGKWTVEF